MRTYGNSEWVAKTGVVNTPTISGKDIFGHLEIKGKLPNPLEPAIEHHLATVKTIGEKWKVVLEAHAKILHDACEATKGLETNAEKADRLHALLKNVKHPNLLKNVSFSGLMGTISKDSDGGLHICCWEGSEPPMEPIARERLATMAALTCKILTSTDGFYKAYHVSIMEEEALKGYGNQEEADGTGYDLWDHLCEEDHTPSLFFYEDQLYRDTYWELIASGVEIARALELWMHRSVK